MYFILNGVKTASPQWYNKHICEKKKLLELKKVGVKWLTAPPRLLCVISTHSVLLKRSAWNLSCVRLESFLSVVTHDVAKYNSD